MEAGKKKILYVITKANWGGAQRYVYDLAIAMRALGNEVAVAYGEDGHLREKLDVAGIRTLPVAPLSRDVAWRGEWEAWKALLALIRQEKPDVIHVNSSKGGLALLAARIARVPRIVFTAHGWAFNEKRPWWQKLLMRGAYVMSAYLAHATICVSEAVSRELGYLPGASRAVVKHGMDATAFLAKAKARKTLVPSHSEGIWLGMLAELHPTKRVEDAIDAFAELAEEYPTLELVVIGDGELREWLLERVRHYGLENRVHFTGFLPDGGQYLKAFDIFLMPSRTEALGLALMEAGYAGLPVVASRIGGIPEIVKNKKTGLLVPRENPHALARAIRILLDDPAQASIYGAELAKDTMARFSKEKMILGTLAVYEKNPPPQAL